MYEVEYGINGINEYYLAFPDSGVCHRRCKQVGLGTTAERSFFLGQVRMR